jgi:Cu(I)/Ag(I) efflux system membrane fusion protein
MIELIQSFGHAIPDALVQIHCPMAFEGLGADWLQRGNEVRNPYFGPEMLGCGNRVATFESQAPLQVPDSFRSELARIYDPYFKLQEALADDRLPDATTAWTAMRTALQSVRPEGLDSRSSGAWQAASSELARNLNPEWKEPTIDEVRKYFQALSGTMLALADAFGHPRSSPLYRAYCPMAFKDKGAAWLQAGDQIANPYFGHEMLRCGVIQRTFAARRAPEVER